MTDELQTSKYEQPCSVNDGIELRNALLAHEYAYNPDYPADLQTDINNLVETIILDYCFAKEQIRRHTVNRNFNYKLGWLVAEQYMSFDNPTSYAAHVLGQSGPRNFLQQCFRYDDTLNIILMEFYYIAWSYMQAYIEPNTVSEKLTAVVGD